MDIGRIGLPRPVWPDKTEPTVTETGRRTSAREGQQVHRIVGELAPLVGDISIAERNALVAQATRQAVNSKADGRLAKARMRVNSLVNCYFGLYFPPREFEILGHELNVGDGLVDLAWSHATGVLFDELKTHRELRSMHTADIDEQLHRYRLAGRDLYGDRFLGVRLIALGNSRDSFTLLPDGTTTPETKANKVLHLAIGRTAA